MKATVKTSLEHRIDQQAMELRVAGACTPSASCGSSAVLFVVEAEVLQQQLQGCRLLNVRRTEHSSARC